MMFPDEPFFKPIFTPASLPSVNPSKELDDEIESINRQIDILNAKRKALLYYRANFYCYGHPIYRMSNLKDFSNKKHQNIDVYSVIDIIR